MTIRPIHALPEMNDWEFKDLTKGRREAAVEAYKARVGCSAEDANAVADHWYSLAFPNEPKTREPNLAADPWICEACNGPLELLGVLGAREHARCRACGLDHNRPVAVDGEDVGPPEPEPYRPIPDQKTGWTQETALAFADALALHYGTDHPEVCPVEGSSGWFVKAPLSPSLDAFLGGFIAGHKARARMAYAEETEDEGSDEPSFEQEALAGAILTRPGDDIVKTVRDARAHVREALGQEELNALQGERARAHFRQTLGREQAGVAPEDLDALADEMFANDMKPRG